MKIRHSVIIITYNQENLISRTLASILNQKHLVHEIIISDDCSTDNTWDRIMAWKEEFPKIIKAYRNSKNLGIIANTESTFTKTTGDLIWYIAGDDELCFGIFECANRIIYNNKIDVERDSYTLYFDYKKVEPNGKSRVVTNDRVNTDNIISLKIRQLISNRTSAISKNVFSQFYSVRKDIGIMADGLIDIQTQLFSSNNYYQPFVGSIYYESIGISSRVSTDDLNKSEILFLTELMTFDQLNDSDIKWIQYRISQLLFFLNRDKRSFISYCKKFRKGVTLKFGFNFFFREFIRLIISSKKII